MADALDQVTKSVHRLKLPEAEAGILVQRTTGECASSNRQTAHAPPVQSCPGYGQATPVNLSKSAFTTDEESPSPDLAFISTICQSFLSLFCQVFV